MSSLFLTIFFYFKKSGVSQKFDPKAGNAGQEKKLFLHAGEGVRRQRRALSSRENGLIAGLLGTLVNFSASLVKRQRKKRTWIFRPSFNQFL